jgi:hypothetical protein
MSLIHPELHQQGKKVLQALHDLGLNLAYYPGSVVGLCGTIFEHEVRAWGSGDRVCYAHFMRETVRQRLGVPAAGWAMQETYAQYLPEDIRQSKEFLI